MRDTNRLEEIFLNNKGNLINKWDHYFEIYDRFFHKHVGNEVTILEIGIFQGGSLQMWKEYFGPKSVIYGIDINPDCKKFEDDGVHILIGSQEDRSFLRSVKEQIPRIDILIDDGGHTMRQQITTFDELFDHVSDEGVYLCEDTHTSYWMEYGGGLRHPDSFIEKSKDLIDSLSGWHYGRVDHHTRSIKSVSFFDSIVVIEKGDVKKPTLLAIGRDNQVENLVETKTGQSRRLYFIQTVLKRIWRAFDRR